MNQVHIRAKLIELSPIRQSPAGLPILELELDHRSEVIEAGHPRTVEFMIRALAIGPNALKLQNAVPGSEFSIQGFLAPSRKNSSKLVLHIQVVSVASEQVFTQTYVV